MPIKMGNLREVMNKENPVQTFFLSNSIPKLPSTKPRNEQKRATVLIMEIEQIRNRVGSLNKYAPLMKRRNGE